MFNENNHNEIASESGIILFLLEKDEGEHINFGIDFGRKPCFHKTHIFWAAILEVYPLVN
jgi:hypothetical protein